MIRRVLAALVLCLAALPAWAIYPPVVDLNSPADGDQFIVGQTVALSASGIPMNGEITSMDLYLDGVLYAHSTTDQVFANWTATVGTHTVSAKASDEARSKMSPVVTITVIANSLPAVTLTAPSNNAAYNTGATVAMAATASDSDGTINRVEFLVDGSVVGQDTSSPYTFNWTAATGGHQVQARAVDNASGTTTTAQVLVQVNTPPSVSLTTPVNGATYTPGATVAMTASASDSDGTINRVEFLVDGNVVGQDTSSPYAYNWTATNGSHQVQARAVDNLNGSAITTQATIQVNTPPTVSVTAPSNGARLNGNAFVTLSANAGDSDGTINRVEFWVDGTKLGQDTSTPYTYNWTVPTATGNHSIQAKAVDNNNATTASGVVTVIVNTPPSTTLTAPTAQATYAIGDAVPLAATASDTDGSITLIEFFVDGAKVAQDASSPFGGSWTAATGNHVVEARATDNDGGIQMSVPASIHVTALPTVTLGAPANNAVYAAGTTVNMTATAADSDGTINRVEFLVDGVKVGQDATNPYAYDWSATAGSHTVQARAVDNLGATKTTTAINIQVGSPPAVSLSSPASGASYITGTTVPMAATASDSDGNVARVEFLVDGSVVGQDTVSPYALNWTANIVTGSHTVQARAVDNLNMTTITSPININIVPDSPPTVALTTPANGASYTTGATVAMSATAGDSDGTVNRVDFLVDDAVVGQDSSSPYAYNWTATTGNHTVKARAVDNLGATTSTSGIGITVNATNSPPTVGLTAPASGASYANGAAVSLTATASDSDGTISRVDFLVDDAVVGQDSNSPYSYSWASTTGSHTVKARAVDNLGATTTTSGIGITVASNSPPTVSLTAPANGASYASGALVSMTATASDSDGTINRVEFWVDGANIGQDTVSPYTSSWAVTGGDHVLLAKAVDNLGATTSAASVTIHGPVTLTRKYTYNSYQELCSVEEPETGVTVMGYDGAGNLTWSASGLPAGTACSSTGNTTAINARKAARTYDARNRIETLAFPDLNGNQSWTYTPDGLPDTVTTRNDGGAAIVTNTYGYNRRRMLVSETLGQDGNPDTWAIGYGYDVNGSPASLVYPTGLTVSYAPNGLGQPTQVASTTQTFASGITYYPNGAIAGFTYGNGIVHSLTQNARGLPERSRDLDGSTPIHDDSYDYDAVGNVLAISDGVTGNRGDRDMVYDDLNRLESASSAMFGTASYTYDAIDNLRHVTVTGGTKVRDQEYVYDQYNRLTNLMEGGASVVGIGYDVQGNLANKNGVLYGFDYGNRMRSGGPETYRYDAYGRRVRSMDASTHPIYSLYGQDGTLLWQRDERTSQRRNYVYLQGSLLAEHRRPIGSTTETIIYQHTDALGSPVVTTDSGRNPGPRREYEPYGYQTLPTTLEDGPGYTGHVTDAATGLVYMQQRYYDPLCGCFLSTDPVTALGGAFNRYWYANANPYRMVDPDGRWPKWLTEIFGISTDSAGAKHEVNQFAENMVGSKYESMAKPVQQAAETASKIVDAVDQRVEVSVEGTLAEGAAVKGSVDVTRGKAAIGIAPIAGQGARLAVSISSRNPIRIPLVPNAKEAPVRMNLFEVHVVEGIGGGVKVGMNGGYLEIKPSIEFGIGATFIKYPSVEFGGN